MYICSDSLLVQEMEEESDDEWSTPAAPKRKKLSECIIHCTDSQEKVVSPRSLESWKTLLHHARLQNFAPVLDIASKLQEGEIGQAFYHNRCRSTFILQSKESNSSDGTKSPDAEKTSQRRLIMPRTPTEKIILPVICIFCYKVTKGKNREGLTKCELKKDEGKGFIGLAQRSIYNAAKAKCDERIISLCETYDLISAEAHYHHSCKRNYEHSIPKETPISKKSPEIVTESRDDTELIFKQWFDHIRQKYISNHEITTVELLLSQLQEISGQSNQCTDKVFKRKARRHLLSEFQDSVDIFRNKNGKLIFLPKSLSKQELAENYMELKTLHDQNIKETGKALKSVTDAAMIVRNDVLNLEDKLSWPPKLMQLSVDHVQLPSTLTKFLSILFHGSELKSDKVLSIGQDIVYITHRGRFITPKHLLLPFAIKSMTGNVELIKTLNRLGHGISYSKLLEVDTANAIQKVSSDCQLIPEEIYPYQQVTLVYDNIDRLEETLSGGGTTHRVNGIAIQKPFIGPRQLRERQNIPKSKKRSLDVAPLHLPDYIAGIRPDPPLLRCIALRSYCQMIQCFHRASLH